MSIKIRIGNDEFEFTGSIGDVPLTQVIAWVNQWFEGIQSTLQKKVDALSARVGKANTELEKAVDANTPPVV